LGQVATGILELLRYRGDSESAEVAALAMADALQRIHEAPKANAVLGADLLKAFAKMMR
jgi:hypothetical protein